MILAFLLRAMNKPKKEADSKIEEEVAEIDAAIDPKESIKKDEPLAVKSRSGKTGLLEKVIGNAFSPVIQPKNPKKGM